MSSAPPDSTTGSHGLERKINEVSPQQQEKVPKAAKAAKKQEKEQNLERLKVFLESLYLECK